MPWKYLRSYSDTIVFSLIESPQKQKRLRYLLLCLILTSIAVLSVKSGFPLKYGLTGRYYANGGWRRSPVMVMHDPSIALGRMERRDPPQKEYYSIEWRGVIRIPRTGEYHFTTGSDDGSRLVIDDQLIVDNGGNHAYVERSGTVTLEKGWHPFMLRYSQNSGLASLKCFWKPPGRRQDERLPSTVLFPEQPPKFMLFIHDMIVAAWLIIKYMCLFAAFAFGLLLLLSYQIIASHFRQSKTGKILTKAISWVLADNEGQPEFGWLPQHARPLPRLLFLILLISFVLNITGISWGLPGFRGWAADEITPAAVLAGIEQNFSDGWYDKYPPFHYYLLTVAYWPFLLLDRLSLIDMQSPSVYTVLFYVGRLMSVLMGTATVFLVFLCGCELYDRQTSLFAASISGLSLPFLYYSKITNLDIPYTFWFVVSLYFYIRILKYHRTADYLLFSAAATLSICTKDQAYGLYFLIPIAIAVSYYRYRKQHHVSAHFLSALINRKTLASLLFAIVLFGLIQNVMLNWEGFTKHVELIVGPGSEQYRMYAHDLQGHLSMLWQSLRHIRFALGWPMSLTCIAGLVLAFLQRKKSALLFWLLVPGISYYVSFISVIGYNYVRFFLPIGIILVFFGALSLSWLVNVVPPRFSRISYAVVVGILLYGVFYSASVDVLMNRDSRYYVEAWMEEHIPEQAKIGMIGLIEYLPRITTFERKQYFLNPPLQEVRAHNPDYLVINSGIKLGKQPIHASLHHEDSGYMLVLQYRSKPGLVLWDHRDIYKNGRRNIVTNLDKINPEIKIFKRIQ